MAVATPSPSTDYGKELAKHEQHHTRFTNDEVPPGNPYVYREYPRMVYKAVQHPKTGQMFCMAIDPSPMMFSFPQEYQNACAATAMLNRQCYRVVQDDTEFRIAKNDGWHESPGQALSGHEEDHWKTVVEDTAKRHFSDRRMSPEAQAEAAAVDASTEHQVPDVQVEQSRRIAKERR